MAQGARIVVCAPAQTPAERHEGRVIVTALREAGYTTYWPPDDGLDAAALGAVLTERAPQPALRRRAALLAERLAVTVDRAVVTAECAGAVVDVNGQVLDARCVYLAATAATSGVPVVAYRQPTPTVWDAGPGPVVAALARDWEPVERIDAIGDALRDAIAATPCADGPPPRRHGDTAAGLWLAAHRDVVVDALAHLPDLEHRLRGPFDETWTALLSHLGAPAARPFPVTPPGIAHRWPAPGSGWGHGGTRTPARDERGWVRPTPGRADDGPPPPPRSQ